MIAAVVTAVALTLPGTFHEAKRLEPAASYVAGKPVKVYCARTDLDLREYTQQLYGGKWFNDTGLALIPDGIALLGQSVCDPLLSELRIGKYNADFAEAIDALVHEAVHLRGVTDEGQTECTAVHNVPRVAVKFFRIKPGKQLRALMSDVWGAYSGKPLAYQSVCGPPPA